VIRVGFRFGADFFLLFPGVFSRSAWNPKLWKGANRLGKALMRVRAELIAQGGREGAREGEGEGAREGAKEGAREGAREGAAVVEPARVAAAAAL